MNEELKELRNELNDYARLKVNLAWLKSLKVSSKVWSEIMTTVILVIILVIALTIASIAFALYLARLIGDPAVAFGIVSGAWLFTFLVALIFKKGIIIRPLRNSFLSTITKNVNIYIKEEDEDKE